MACKILRLRDEEGLDKKYLNAWKSGKVCCPHDNCFSQRLLLNLVGLGHLYRMQHSGDRVCDEEMRRGKSALKSPVAAESLESLLLFCTIYK